MNPESDEADLARAVQVFTLLKRDGAMALSVTGAVTDMENVSLVEAYAVGHVGVLTAAGQRCLGQDGEHPEWLGRADPVETLFAGALHAHLPDPFAFANCCDEWLRMLVAAGYRDALTVLVRESLAVSRELARPVNDLEVAALVLPRLDATGLGREKIPPHLMPRVALPEPRGTLAHARPPLPRAVPRTVPGEEAGSAAFWRDVRDGEGNDGSVGDALRVGLRFVADLGCRMEAPADLLAPLYMTIAGPLDMQWEELAIRSVAWAGGLLPDSPTAAVVDGILAASDEDLTLDDALDRLCLLPAFSGQVQESDRILRTAPNAALDRLALELDA